MCSVNGPTTGDRPRAAGSSTLCPPRGNHGAADKNDVGKGVERGELPEAIDDEDLPGLGR